MIDIGNVGEDENEVEVSYKCTWDEFLWMVLILEKDVGEDENEVERCAHLPLDGICSLLDVARISYYVVVIMIIFLLIMDHHYHDNWNIDDEHRALWTCIWSTREATRAQAPGSRTKEKIRYDKYLDISK